MLFLCLVKITIPCGRWQKDKSWYRCSWKLKYTFLFQPDIRPCDGVFQRGPVHHLSPVGVVWSNGLPRQLRWLAWTVHGFLHPERRWNRVFPNVEVCSIVARIKPYQCGCKKHCTRCSAINPCLVTDPSGCYCCKHNCTTIRAFWFDLWFILVSHFHMPRQIIWLLS